MTAILVDRKGFVSPKSQWLPGPAPPTIIIAVLEEMNYFKNDASKVDIPVAHNVHFRRERLIDHTLDLWEYREA
jgi:hypothetical protein